VTTDPYAPADNGISATRAAEIELFSVAGHDGHLREVNAAFARLLGLSTEEVDGRSLLELVHPEDIEQIVAGLAALEGGAAEVLLENRFLQWVARPLPGTDLWWAAGRDTTEFHRLLARELDMHARLDLALGPATAAMWELDLRQGLLTWEPQAAEVLDVPTDALPTSAEGLAALALEEDALPCSTRCRHYPPLGRARSPCASARPAACATSRCAARC